LKNSFYAIPKIYHFLTLWIYIFAIVLSSLIGILSISEPQDKTLLAVVIYAIIVEIILSVIRPFYTHIVYQMYFKNEDQNKAASSGDQNLTER